MNGTYEHTNMCDDVKTHNDVLHAWYRGYNTAASWCTNEHRGSWPLVNIKKWWTEPA